MINKKFKLIVLTFLLIFSLLSCKNSHNPQQLLKPYFNKNEYKELLLISIRTTNLKKYYSKFPLPENYKLVFQSKEIGLANLWQLWINKKQPIAVLSVRGTIRKTESALSNFYATMVPAKGKLKLSDKFIFKYELALDTNAAVHVGWLISTAFLSREIVPKIDSLYKTGIKNFLIIGHSQGGAISYLLTAYLYSLQKNGKIPQDIRFKTYCSAPPKPGNIRFAYYYETITKGGWSCTVVSAADWVPEVPITIQTLRDLNSSNPFSNLDKEIDKLNFPKRLIAKYLYNRIKNPPEDAEERFEDYLGKKLEEQIQKYIKGYTPPENYFHSFDYVRTGNQTVLYPDKNYYKKFPKNTKDMLLHHNYDAYLFLINNNF